MSTSSRSSTAGSSLVDTRKRILLVDPDTFARNHLVSILAKGTYEPVQAPSAKHALLLLAREPLDLVLTELLLPQFDGTELIEIIRSNPLWARLPIVMCSTVKDPHVIRAAAQFNIQGYLLGSVLDVEMDCD